MKKLILLVLIIAIMIVPVTAFAADTATPTATVIEEPIMVELIFDSQLAGATVEVKSNGESLGTVTLDSEGIARIEVDKKTITTLSIVMAANTVLTPIAITSDNEVVTEATATPVAESTAQSTSSNPTPAKASGFPMLIIIGIVAAGYIFYSVYSKKKKKMAEEKGYVEQGKKNPYSKRKENAEEAEEEAEEYVDVRDNDKFGAEEDAEEDVEEDDAEEWESGGEGETEKPKKKPGLFSKKTVKPKEKAKPKEKTKVVKQKTQVVGKKEKPSNKKEKDDNISNLTEKRLKAFDVESDINEGKGEDDYKKSTKDVEVSNEETEEIDTTHFFDEEKPREYDEDEIDPYTKEPYSTHNSEDELL